MIHPSMTAGDSSARTLVGALKAAYRAWMWFARLLSRVTTPVLLGIVYFLVLTPTGLVMRVFGKDALGRARDTGWVRRSAPRSDLERQF